MRRVAGLTRDAPATALDPGAAPLARSRGGGHAASIHNEERGAKETADLGPGAQGEDSDRFWSSQGHRCPHLFQPDLRPAIRLTHLGQHSKEARLPGSTSRCAHDKGEAAAAA